MPQLTNLEKECRHYEETRQEICEQDQPISAFSCSRISIKEREPVKVPAGNKVFFKCWKSVKLIPKAKNFKFAETDLLHSRLMMLATILGGRLNPGTAGRKKSWNAAAATGTLKAGYDLP